MNQETKICQNCKQAFIIEAKDFQFYKKINVPPPTFCSACRFQRRIAFRNERKLFRNVSGKTGKKIFSLIPPESGANVYEEFEWYAYDWDGLSYGRNYDFSRPFFAQFYELSKAVPRFNLSITFSVNSDYCANAGYLKNCYLIFNANYDENCAYSNGIDHSNDCFDNSNINKCEKCYGSLWLFNCYKVNFSLYCEDCTDVWFSKNLRGCSNCFSCVNLKNKKYYIFNKPYSKEEYEKIVVGMNLHRWSVLNEVKDKAVKFWLDFPNKYLQGIKNLNVSGEYITQSKNVINSYLIREGENLRYSQYLQVPPNKDCYDFTIWGEGNELGYEDLICGYGTYNCKFCFESWTQLRDLEYCGYCISCKNCFGCFGLRNKEYCILNKQYSKEEYLSLRDRIIDHMEKMPYLDKRGRFYKYGEFFPIEHSPQSYNNSLVNEYFPLSKEEVITNGYRWIDIPPTEYETTMKSSSLPDSIFDVSDSILKEILQCENCKRAYRIIAPELNFLKSEGLPIPRLCVDCRHNSRISQKNKNNLYKRHCSCLGKGSDNGNYINSVMHFHGTGQCPNEFETSYSPDRKEIIYCEQCYNVEVV